MQACGLAGMRASVNLQVIGHKPERGKKERQREIDTPETQGHRQKA
jgi:hypothetical protein